MSENVERVEALRALERLREGNRRYLDAPRNDADVSAEVRKNTALRGQHPFAIVVACSDSRVVPEHLFMAGIGELFTIRVAGNVIDGTQLASVVYAAAHVGARLVLVLGHTRCGAVGAAMEGGAHGCVSAVTDLVAAAIGDERDDYAACVKNVRAQVGRLAANAEVAALVEGEGLMVAGGVYHVDTGEVEFLDIVSEAAPPEGR